MTAPLGLTCLWRMLCVGLLTGAYLTFTLTAQERPQPDPDVEFFNTFEAALSRIEGYEKEEAALRRQLEREPGDIDAQVKLGAVLQRLRKSSEAIETLEKAIL